MKKSYSLSLAALGLLGLTAVRAWSGGTNPLAGFVQLQGATPGVAESGHANITGTLKAGKVQTNVFQLGTVAPAGSVLTANASGTGTWQAPFFPVPFTGATGTAGAVIGGKNTLASGGYGLKGEAVGTSGTGVYGVASKTTSANFGGYFEAFGDTGTAVAGHARSSTGTTVGGNFTNKAQAGSAVRGEALATLGNAAGGFFATQAPNGAGVTGIAMKSAGGSYGGYFESKSGTGTGVSGWATAASGINLGASFGSNSTSGTGVLARAMALTGNTVAGYFEAKSPTAIGVRSETIATSGQNYAGFFRTASPAGVGVYGFGSATTGLSIGVRGQTASTAGLGVYGVATAGSSTGVRGDSTGPSGMGVYGYASQSSGIGVRGDSAGSAGAGVYGYASSATGSTIGVHGEAASPNGVAVFGHNKNLTDGVGVSGFSDGFTGAGLYGKSTSYGYGVRAFSEQGLGLLSESNGGNAIQGISYSPAGIGVYAIGNFDAVHADGNITASGTKSFLIDHPLDPQNKYLVHYCNESPMPQNSYSGNTVTDSKGTAWVELPAYFGEINTNFKYQLTVLSSGQDFVQAMVSKEIQDNRFQIRTSTPRTKVSWRVEADRNDPWVRKSKPVVEVEKPEAARGKFLQPELYGFGPERQGRFTGRGRQATPGRRP